MPTALAYTAVGATGIVTLREAIASAQGGDVLSPVTVVASSVRGAVGLRRSLVEQTLHKGTGVANVRFLVFADIAHQYGAPSLGAKGLIPLTRHGLIGAVRRALADDAGLFRPILGHSSTEEELARSYTELRFSNEGTIEQFSSLGRRQSEIARIFQATRRFLLQYSYDEVDLFNEAVQVLANGCVADELGAVVFYMPEQLRAPEAALFAELSRVTAVKVIFARTGDGQSDELERLLVERFVQSLDDAHLEAIWTDQSSDTTIRDPFLCDDGHDELISAPDPETEVRSAFRVILSALRNDVRPARIALLYAARAPYLQLIAEYAATTRVPIVSPSPNRLETTSSARFLRALVTLLEAPLTRRSLIELADAAPLRLGGEQVSVPEWDRCSRLSGFVAGNPEEFLVHLDDLARQCAREIEQERAIERADGAPSRRERRAERTTDACIGLSRFITAIASTLDAGRHLRSWTEFSYWARQALMDYLAISVVRGMQPSDDDHALGELVFSLEMLDIVGPTPSPGEFSRMLGSGLAQPCAPLGTFGSGVFVGPFGSSAPLAFDLVVLVGVGDGLFNGRGRDLVLSANEREHFGLDAQNPADLRRRGRSALAKALGVAPRRIVFSPSSIESPGQFVVPRPLARWAPTLKDVSRATPLDAIAQGNEVALTETELVSAELLASRRDDQVLMSHHLVTSSPALTSRLLMRGARIAHHFDAFSGAIGSSKSATELDEVRLSPTTLEEYANCPFRYFLSHVLWCEAIDVPESRFVIEARDRGSLVHEILERYVAGLLGNAAQRSEDEERRCLAAIAEESFAKFERTGQTGRKLLWAIERRRLLRIVERESQRDGIKRALESRTPVVVEHRFGGDQDVPVEVKANGHTLSFRGVIDRIDTDRDGALFVIDYKTGRADNYRVLGTDPLDRGRHLQLPIYALAARESFGDDRRVEAAYRFVERDGEEISVELDDRVAHRFHEVIDVLVTGIDDGMFIAHPGPRERDTHANCTWCDFDAICPPDRGLFFECGKGEPSVTSYAGLAEEEWTDSNVFGDERERR